MPAHSSAPRISSVNRHLAAAACVALTAGELDVAAIGVLSSPSGHHDVAAGVPLATLAGSRSDNNVAALGADAVEVVAVASTARDEHAPAGVAGGSGLPSRDLDIASVASVATANLQLDVATGAVHGHASLEGHGAGVAGSGFPSREGHGSAHSGSAGVRSRHRHGTAVSGVPGAAGDLNVTARGVGRRAGSHRNLATSALGVSRAAGSDRDLSAVALVAKANAQGNVAPVAARSLAGGYCHRPGAAVRGQARLELHVAADACDASLRCGHLNVAAVLVGPLSTGDVDRPTSRACRDPALDDNLASEAVEVCGLARLDNDAAAVARIASADHQFDVAADA